MWRLYSYMYVARADSSCILNVYTLHGFSGQSNFFLYKKYIEFNTVANLIRLHSYSRRVSRMTDELVMLAEWQNEYGSDYLILMRGWGRGREDVFGSGVVSSATRSCLSIRLLYKMYYIVYPCLGYFSWQNRILDFFFSQNLHVHPNKN